jgi:hypothetical protein
LKLKRDEVAMRIEVERGDEGWRLKWRLGHVITQ